MEEREVTLTDLDGQTRELLIVPAEFGGVEEVVDQMRKWCQRAYDMGRKDQAALAVEALRQQANDITFQRKRERPHTIKNAPTSDPKDTRQMAQVEYRKGPIGWSVTVDGKPVGRIRDQRGTAPGGWYISIDGMAPTGVGKNEMLRRTLKAAKQAVEDHFKN